MDITQRLEQIAQEPGVEPATKIMAEHLQEVEAKRAGVRTEKADRYLPDKVLPVCHEWSGLFADVTSDGMKWANESRIAICGMARNLEGILPVTFHRLAEIVKHFRHYGIAIVENDSDDDTKAILQRFADDNPGHVVLSMTDRGWQHLHGFERERVERYAILRNECRQLLRDHWPDADVVLVVDLDCWGGWSVPGLLNGCGWLQRQKTAGCMASTSLFQHEIFADEPKWGHYDTWALRAHGWKHEPSPWKTLWLPPPGSPPIEVFSAFGGAALYRPEAFWQSAYASIDGDIEHAGLHRAMRERGWGVYLNPSQRSLMFWLTEEHHATRQHGSD